MINQLQKQIILILVLKTTYKTDKTELEKKIPGVTNLVKKTNTLNNHNHDKYINTSEFNKLAGMFLIRDLQKSI